MFMRAPATQPATIRPLIAVGLGTLVVPLDSAVNVAFPHITAAFGLDIPQIQWLVISYTLTYASLTLAFGRIGDIVGHRLVFILGTACSACAFAACGAAPSYAWLLLARVLQGIGAALVLSCGPALVTAGVDDVRRLGRLGFYTMVFGLGGALGPLIAGPLIARWGWPSVYWVRAPAAAIACLLAVGLPGAPRRVSVDGASVRGEFDLPGAIWLVATIAALVFSLDRLRHLSGGAAALITGIAATVLALAGFIRRELAIPRPIIDLRVFRDPRFALVNAQNALVNFAGFSVFLLLPFYLARMAALSLPLTGVALAASPIGITLAGPLAARYAGRVTRRHMILAGSLLTAAGLGWIGLGWTGPVDRPARLLPLWAAMFAAGVGQGLFQLAYFDMVTAALPARDRGVAGSLAMVTRTLGVVSAATLLMLLFGALQGSALAAGMDADTAFLAGIDGTFRLAALLPLPLLALELVLPRRPACRPGGDRL